MADFVLHALPDLVVTVDEAGTIEFVSGSCARLLGFRPEELVGHRVCEFLGGEDRRNTAVWSAHVLHGRDVPELTHTVTRADGSIAWFETRIRRLPRDGGNPAVVAVSRDVSERTVLDRQLAEERDIWSEVADLIRAGVLVIDEGGLVVTANRVAGELLEVDPAELSGSDVRRFLVVLGDRSGRAQPFGGHPLTARALRARSHGELSLAARRSGGVVRLRGHAAALPPMHGPLSPARFLLLLEATAGHPGPGPAAAAVPDALSPREVEVLRLLADGLDVHAIAGQLRISIHTVRAYVKSILKKLNARTQLQAVVVALRTGLLELP